MSASKQLHVWSCQDVDSNFMSASKQLHVWSCQDVNSNFVSPSKQLYEYVRSSWDVVSKVISPR